MPQLDQYQPCVCGSAKKFKFCKCGAVDHALELEKILRLIEGGQELAAVDRINSLLTKLPSAAWLLAIKADLLLSMQEYESLVETSQRFLKLKPDNPLALIFCSIATGLQDEAIELQAKHLLNGLAESREAMPSPAGYAVQLMTQRILLTENVALLGIWGELQEMISRQAPMQSVLLDPSIHLICKTPSRIIESPNDAPWIERMDEVRALASSFRYEQAEKKLHSILRDFPNQPGPLSYLLRAQAAQLKRQDAIATSKKLAEHGELSLDDRAYFRVLSWEYESSPLVCNGMVRYGEIEADDELIDKLSDMDEVRIDDMDESREFMATLVGDVVPAKRVYQLFQSQPDDSGDLKVFAAVIAVYGKQTDQPARALLMAADFPPYRPLLEKTLSVLNFARELNNPPEYTQVYEDFLNRNAYIHGSDRPWVTLETRGRMLVEDFLNLPFKVLDGKTPLEAAGQAQRHDSLTALLLHLQGVQSIVVPAQAIAEIYRRLSFQPPALLSIPQSEKTTALASLMDLVRIDLSLVQDGLLLSLADLILNKGAYRLQLEVAGQILSRPSLADKSGALLMAHSVLFELNPDLDAKLQHAKKMEELLVAAGKPVGQIVLRQMGIMANLGRDKAAQETLLEAVRKYPNDPELAAFLERLQPRNLAVPANMSEDDLALKMLDGASQRSSSREPAGSLILPGDEPQPQQESKLWLPGT